MSIPYITQVATDVIIPEKPVRVQPRAPQTVDPVDPETPSDRFKVHVLGPSSLSGIGDINMLLTGTDPEYETGALNPYGLAQKGLALVLPDDNLNIHSMPDQFEIGDDYPTDDETVVHLPGILMEIYNTEHQLGGTPKTISINSLAPTNSISCAGAVTTVYMAMIAPVDMTEEDFNTAFNEISPTYLVDGLDNEWWNVVDELQVDGGVIPPNIIPSGYKSVVALGWGGVSQFTNTTYYDKRLSVQFPIDTPIAYVLWGNTTAINTVGGDSKATVCLKGDPNGNSSILPTGIYTTDQIRDQSALMNNSTLSVIPSKGTATVHPLTALKGTGVYWCPAVINPPFLDGDPPRPAHKLGIVIGMNGGAPKLCTYNFNISMQVGGSPAVNWSDLQWAIVGLMNVVNESFQAEMDSFIANGGVIGLGDTGPIPEDGEDLPPIFGGPTQLMNGRYSMDGYFNVETNVYNMTLNQNLYLPTLNIYGGTDWQYEKERLWYEQFGNGEPWNNPANKYVKVVKPLFITIYPQHELLDGEGVTIDVGLDEGFKGIADLKPFSIHTTLGYVNQPM